MGGRGQRHYFSFCEHADLHELPHLTLKVLQRFYYRVLQVRKPKLGEVKEVAQLHKAKT